jgi:hypothetical protein
MDIKQGILSSLAQSDMVVGAYLADLTSEELLARPLPGANHIAWQWGHLISSERFLIEKIAPGKMPVLSEAFETAHKRDNAASDDPASFLTKEQYEQLAREVRGVTLSVVKDLTPEDLDQPVAKLPPTVKVVGDLFFFLSMHWLMHAGQWALVRRKLGRPPLF